MGTALPPQAQCGGMSLHGIRKWHGPVCGIVALAVISLFGRPLNPVVSGNKRMSFIHGLKESIIESSRAHKVEHFYSLCPEGSTVIDVGVSRQKKKQEKQQIIF